MGKITGDYPELIAALRSIGLAGAARVVIDIQAGAPVRIFTEQYGDDNIIQVIQALDGVQITTVPATPVGTEEGGQ